MIYVHWHHIWNRFLLVFLGVRNRPSSWSQLFLCTPRCELSRELKYLHLTTLLVSTTPALCALHLETQSSHPGRDKQGGISAVPGDPLHTGLPAAQRVEKGWHIGSRRPAPVLGIFYIAPVTFSLLSFYLDFYAIKSC